MSPNFYLISSLESVEPPNVTKGRLLDHHQDLASAGVHDDCSVDVVKDQRLILTASHDGTAKLWRPDGKCASSKKTMNISLFEVYV